MTSERAVNALIGTIALGLIAIAVLTFFWLLFLVIYDKKNLWRNLGRVTLAEVLLLAAYVVFEMMSLINTMADAL